MTLTTDWGHADFFAGMVKGRLYSLIPNVRVVDITHGIRRHDHQQTVFLMRHACQGFPQGTIHIIDVDSVETSKECFVVILHNGQYYICTDNGIPCAVFGQDYSRAVRIEVMQDSDTYTFAAHDLFCKVAAMIANGTPLEAIGPDMERLKQLTQMRPIEIDNALELHIDYFDTYGNAYLDITYEEFERIRRRRQFTVSVREYSVTTIGYSYHESPAMGQTRVPFLLLVSATGLLELAIKRDNAKQLIGLTHNTPIKVQFFGT